MTLSVRCNRVYPTSCCGVDSETMSLSRVWFDLMNR